MKIDKTVMLRIWLQDVAMGKMKHPREWFENLAPTSIRSEWVPQTMGDQIWLFYEFDDRQGKEAFLSELPDNLKPTVEAKLEVHHIREAENW
jgi:hypothetical protein